MSLNVGDVIRTKNIPRTLGVITDSIYIGSNSKTVFQIFFEDSDEPEWYYKDNIEAVKNKKEIFYMNQIYFEWECSKNVSSD